MIPPSSSFFFINFPVLLTLSLTPTSSVSERHIVSWGGRDQRAAGRRQRAVLRSALQHRHAWPCGRWPLYPPAHKVTSLQPVLLWSHWNILCDVGRNCASVSSVDVAHVISSCSLLEDRVTRLHGQLQRTQQHLMASSDPGSMDRKVLDDLYEDIHWIILVSGQQWDINLLFVYFYRKDILRFSRFGTHKVGTESECRTFILGEHKWPLMFSLHFIVSDCTPPSKFRFKCLTSSLFTRKTERRCSIYYPEENNIF